MADRDFKSRPYGKTDIRPVLGVAESRVVNRALRILERVHTAPEAPALGHPESAKEILRLRLGAADREEFHALWLDAQHKLIAAETLFVGTLTQTAVYPREVVRSGLAHNAAAVIVGHNHPSGSTQPSQADRSLTHVLKSALSLVDIALLDHIIIARNATRSMMMMGDM